MRKALWLDNLMELEDTGDSGNCPHCGSSDIKITEVTVGRRPILFKCRNCGSSCEFDRSADAPLLLEHPEIQNDNDT